MNLQAYSVAVRLSAQDDLTRVLKMVSQDVLALHKNLQSVVKDLQNITKYAQNATTSITAMSQAMNGRFSGATRDANNYATAMRSVTEQAQRAHSAIKNLPSQTASAMPYLALGAVTGATAAGGSGGYRPPSGLLGLTGPNNTAGNYGGWNGWKNGVPPGGWGGGGQPPGGSGRNNLNGNGHANGMTNLATGYLGYELFNSITEKGVSYERELARLRQMGLDTSQINEAKAFTDSHSVINTSRLDRLRIFTDAQGSFRESGMGGKKAMEAAEVMTPILAKYEVASHALSGQSQAAASGNMRNLNKIVEIMGGLSDTAKAASIVDGVFKASQSSGRMVDERALRLFVAHGSTATNHQSVRAIMGALEPIIGEMGGDVTANGMLTAYNRISGNMSLVPKNLRREMARLGIADATGIEQTRDLTNLQATNLPGYIEKIMKIYKAHGITNSVDIEHENSILFGRSGAKIYNRIMAQMDTIEKSLTSYDISRGTMPILNDPNNHVLMAREAMAKSFEDLQIALAQKGGVMESFTRGIDNVTKGINVLTRAVDSHPNMARYAADGAMVITALAGISGGMWVLKHAANGLIGPLKFLVGSKGFPLLGDTIGALPNIVTMAIAGVLAANATEIYNRIQAMREGKPYDQLLTQTQENKDKEENARRNWNKNNPGQPYIGSRVWDLDGIPAKPGVSKASQFPGVPPKQPITMHITVQSILDGKRIGEHVTKYQTREATKAPSGTSAFDSIMSLTYPGQVSGLSTN